MADLKQALASARYAERVYRLAMEEPEKWPAVAEEIEDDEAEEETSRRSKWLAVLAELPSAFLDDLFDELAANHAIVLCGVMEESTLEDIAIGFLLDHGEAYADEEIAEMIGEAFHSLARQLEPSSKFGRELDARLSPVALLAA
jgi:hypothetical protein